MATYFYFMGLGPLDRKLSPFPGNDDGESSFILSLRVPWTCYFYVLEHGGGGKYWDVYLCLNSPMGRIQVPESHYSIPFPQAVVSNRISCLTSCNYAATTNPTSLNHRHCYRGDTVCLKQTLLKKQKVFLKSVFIGKVRILCWCPFCWGKKNLLSSHKPTIFQISLILRSTLSQLNDQMV